ncbi:MAG: serine/threonine-protein kinase [Bacillota bacterium]
METIGGYTILRELGRGAMGVVYQALQPSSQRFVALKVLPPELADEPGFVERFRREGLIAAGLSHPNIVEVYAAGRSREGVYYIAMELVDGITFSDLIRLHGRLSPAQAVPYVAMVARALAHAHTHGLVHRDVKPANIVIAGATAKLTDFGLARGGHYGSSGATALGTPEYLSPEQARGEPLDGRSDIYSLGIVLYEALTGHPPFTAPSPQEVMAKQLAQAPVEPRRLNPAVSPALQRALLAALLKDRERRYPRAGDFALALEGSVPPPRFRLRDLGRLPAELRPRGLSALPHDWRRFLRRLRRTIRNWRR